jgi:hypothetical protein
MAKIIYRRHISHYRSLSAGSCGTRGWKAALEWSKRLRLHYRKSWAHRAAIDELIRRHDVALPSVMRAGQDYTTLLEDDGELLFPDSIYLMTSCGSHPEWESERSGPCRLFSLIAYPSSF